MKKTIATTLLLLFAGCAPVSRFDGEADGLKYRAEVAGHDVDVRYYQGADFFCSRSMSGDALTARFSDCPPERGLDVRLAPPPALPYRWLADGRIGDFFEFGNGGLSARRFGNAAFGRAVGGRGERLEDGWVWRENGWSMEFRPRRFVLRDESGRIRSDIRRN